jgi:arginyl-tRNA synthetase
MKQKIKNLIIDALTRAYEKGDFSEKSVPKIEVEEPKITSHGDFPTNITMVTASIQKMPLQKIAEAILKYIKDPDRILAKPQIAGAIEASGLNRDRFSVILVQLVNFLREKEPVAMSTRSG